MKRLTLVLAILCLSIPSFSYPILSRTTSGWFPGYNYTDHHLETWVIGDKQYTGWVIRCGGFGFNHCPNRHNLASPIEPVDGDPDDVDVEICGNLLEYADAKLDEYVMNGSYTQRVQVESESFERIYILSWTQNEDGSTETTIEKLIVDPKQ